MNIADLIERIRTLDYVSMSDASHLISESGDLGITGVIVPQGTLRQK